jgi:beta-glucosidase
MTLEEKIGQMTQVDSKAIRDHSEIKEYLIGSVLSGGGSDPSDNTPASWARAVEEYQSWAFRTRLKIPLLYGIDAVHGHNNVEGAVIFPHNIGLGATRNPRLVEQAYRITARETAATGIRWAFAPCVAVAQNPRWGRTYESFGETPEIVVSLGEAAVRGLQGSSLFEPTSVLACAKHFLGDGGTREGIDQGDTVCDEAALRQTHLPAYRAAVGAGVGSVMISYSSWNGKKMHGHKYLLTDVLKEELKFKGIVVSDWAGIDQLSSSYKASIEMSINAGMDMVMIPAGKGEKNSYQDFIRLLAELVSEGRVPPARIDDAVRRILRTKFELGLFEEPFADRRLLASIGSGEHREVARECVRQSQVLLKNERSVLPLARNLKRLHVAGKAAADLGMQCGGWTIDWQGRSGEVTRGGTTLLKAIRERVFAQTQVTYSAGVAGIEGADAVIVVLGEQPYAEGKGDRRNLQLPESDRDLVRSLKKAGIPMIIVLLSGRPLEIDEVLEASDAFLAGWLPGTEGQGVADVLFGDYAPTGKLPCAWRRGSPKTGSPDAKEILFPYGFGLAYTGSSSRPVQTAADARSGM